MPHVIRRFMLFEAGTFIAAFLIHSGRMASGHEAPQAASTEALIAVILLFSIMASWVRPSRIRDISIAAQGFALGGAVISLLAIVVGLGPRTVLDVLYLIGIMAVIVRGLIVARRSSPH